MHWALNARAPLSVAGGKSGIIFFLSVRNMSSGTVGV